MKVRNLSRLFLIFATVAAVLGANPFAGVAQAGSNGQQIYFTCSTPTQGVPVMNYAIIKGYNQAGAYVTWSGWAWWGNGQWSTYVFPQNWWWVGSVRVYWWNARTNSWKSGQYTVPKLQPGSDVVTLSCSWW